MSEISILQSEEDKRREQRNKFRTADTIADEFASIIDATKQVCEHCPPSILAAMVDGWLEADEPLYDQLAQIAFDAGQRNCGALHLAQYVAHLHSPHDTDTSILHHWTRLGIRYEPRP